MLKVEKIDFLSKDLKIIQLKNHYSVSTDSFLLAYFSKVGKKSNKKILDMCAGSGVVSLLLSRKTNSEIYTLEIQEELNDLIKKNIQINKISNITPLCGDLRNIKNIFNPSTFDNIVCNPPYFTMSSMPKIRKKENHDISRHEILCNIDDVLKSIKYLLKQNGSFFLVHRTYRMIEIIEKCRKYKISIKRIRFVYSKKESENSKIILLEGNISNSKDVKIDKPLYIYNDNGTYTEEMKRVYDIV